MTYFTHAIHVSITEIHFFLQCLRGSTFNYIYLDEMCFLRPTVFGEVLPMLQTDSGHLVLTSSHKSGQDRRRFVDMHDLRSDAILINNVTHVCASHIVDMLNSKVSVPCCTCYLFSRPHHFISSLDIRKISTAFSTLSGANGHNVRQEITSKTAMLSEMGIIPPGVTTESLTGDDIDLSGTRLASNAGVDRMCSQLVDVHMHTAYTYSPDIVSEYVAGRQHVTTGSLLFDPVIVVYVDPTQHDVGQSMHAMAFVTRANNIQESADYIRRGTLPTDHYVLLAFEEFQTAWVSHDNDRYEALAQTFISTCGVLTSLYNGYFERIIVVPESNGSCANNFWRLCRSKYARNSYLMKQNIEILCTTVPINIRAMNSGADMRYDTFRNKAADAGQPIYDEPVRCTLGSDMYGVDTALSHLRRRQNREHRQVMERELREVDPLLGKIIGRANGSAEEMILRSVHHQRSSGNSELNNAMDVDEMLHRMTVVGLEQLERNIERCAPEPYRVGYTMCGEKLARITHFFSDCFNPGPVARSTIRCAKLTWSWWLNVSRQMAPQEYVATRMRVLHIRRAKAYRGKSYTAKGKRRYEISGKQNNISDTFNEDANSMINDDLPITISMAVSLYGELEGAASLDDWSGNGVRINNIRRNDSARNMSSSLSKTNGRPVVLDRLVPLL